MSDDEDPAHRGRAKTNKRKTESEAERKRLKQKQRRERMARGREQAWRAVVKRGPYNQSLRKVKRHATKEDIQKRISNVKDKEGDDKSDKLADEGVENIKGRGLVKLASWIAGRHDKYGTFYQKSNRST